MSLSFAVSCLTCLILSSHVFVAVTSIDSYLNSDHFFYYFKTNLCYLLLIFPLSTNFTFLYGPLSLYHPYCSVSGPQQMPFSTNFETMCPLWKSCWYFNIFNSLTLSLLLPMPFSTHTPEHLKRKLHSCISLPSPAPMLGYQLFLLPIISPF